MKFRITVTSVLEYKPRPEDYDTDDPQEMLNIDIDNYERSPTVVFLDSDTYPIVKGEIINE